MYHGKGTIQWNSGKIFRGTFNYNKKQGKGIEVYSDGSIFRGTWKDNLRQGKGESVDANKQCIRFSYDKGVRLDDTKEEVSMETKRKLLSV
mmetsp:Transcript_108847/g.150542  ORF Transcript_108847/g.150542 Transcript_108847/m.150542 type:complete len:91 (+) Transcript_108847:615-887(+)